MEVINEIFCEKTSEEEWIELLLTARNMGIQAGEIRTFLAQTTPLFKSE